jgi:hypothetical protein
VRRLILPLVLLALAAPAPAQAAFTISTTGHKVSRLGPFNPRKDASLQAAVNAFGSPTRTEGAVTHWVNFGLEIRFERGLAQRFSVRSRRFRTWEGLRCGMAEERIMELHPAEKHGHWWWLQRGRIHPTDQRLLPVVKAHVTGGRVDRIDGWIGGAGG